MLQHKWEKLQCLHVDAKIDENCVKLMSSGRWLELNTLEIFGAQEDKHIETLTQAQMTKLTSFFISNFVSIQPHPL